MKQIIITLFFCLLLGCAGIWGCSGQECPFDFSNADLSEIEKIKLSGTTGTENGESTYFLSEEESKEFIDLLKRVELGHEVDESQALGSGAVSYYTLYFYDDDFLVISPGSYFNVDGAYYSFENYDQLWDSFVYFNSLKSPINENDNQD
ncbi:MAG: hypothetical protein U0N90_14690 [Blautia sp.]